MRKYRCVQVTHHLDVPEEIERHEEEGWELVTYTAAQSADLRINHYLLFAKGET